MKKTFFTILVMATAIMIGACGGGKTPKGMATELSNLYQKGDYEKHFEKFFEYLDDKEKEKMPEQTKLVEMIPFIKEYTDKQGGLKDVEISEEKIDGDKAYVDVVYIYNSGEKTPGAYEFEKKDGVWKITARKNI